MRGELRGGSCDKPLIVLYPEGVAEGIVLAQLAKGGMKVVSWGWGPEGDGPLVFKSVTLGPKEKE